MFCVTSGNKRWRVVAGRMGFTRLSPPNVIKTLMFPFSKQHLHTYWGVFGKAADIYKEDTDGVFFQKQKTIKDKIRLQFFIMKCKIITQKIMFYQWDIAWTGIIIKQNNNNNNNNNAIIRWLSRFTIYAVFTRNTEKSSIYIRLCWQQHLRAVSH